MESDKERALEKLLDRAEGVLEFRQTLTPETDRGCALMAAAYLDKQLAELLRLRFVDDSEAAKELLGQDKPLGTFSSRINAAYLLGLIGPQARRDLHLIRKIRNDFGHDPKPLSFEDPPIASRCREFSHRRLAKDSRPRHLFTSVVISVLAHIDHEISTARHIDIPPEVIPGEKERDAFRDIEAKIQKIIEKWSYVGAEKIAVRELLALLYGEEDHTPTANPGAAPDG